MARWRVELHCITYFKVDALSGCLGSTIFFSHKGDLVLSPDSLLCFQNIGDIQYVTAV